MMAFLNNWDLKDDGNNIILDNGKSKRSEKLHYVVSDLGATFGRRQWESSDILANRAEVKNLRLQ